MPTILEAPDFSCHLGTPFSDDVFELHLDDRVRNALHAAKIANAEYDEGSARDNREDPDGPPDPKVAFWTIVIDLGTVEAFRKTVFGQERTLERTDVRLFADRGGSEEFCGIELNRERDLPRLWSERLASTFHSVVRGVCEGVLPERFEGLRDELPPLEAGALAREGIEGASVFDEVIGDWWEPGTEIDVPRLLAAIDGGAKPSHKTSAGLTVSKTEHGTRFIWPLVDEGFRVKLAYLENPKWIVTRYWLSVDIDASGELEDVSVRTDEDQTWAAEGDPGPGGPWLSDLISETAYCAVELVNEFAREVS